MVVVYPTKGLEEEMVSLMVHIYYLCSYILIDAGRRKPSGTLEFQLWPDTFRQVAAACTRNEDLREITV